MLPNICLGVGLLNGSPILRQREQAWFCIYSRSKIDPSDYWSVATTANMCSAYAEGDKKKYGPHHFLVLIRMPSGLGHPAWRCIYEELICYCWGMGGVGR